MGFAEGLNGRGGAWVTRDGRRSDRHGLERMSTDWHWKGRAGLVKRLAATPVDSRSTCYTGHRGYHSLSAARRCQRPSTMVTPISCGK